MWLRCPYSILRRVFGEPAPPAGSESIISAEWTIRRTFKTVKYESENKDLALNLASIYSTDTGALYNCNEDPPRNCEWRVGGCRKIDAQSVVIGALRASGLSVVEAKKTVHFPPLLDEETFYLVVLSRGDNIVRLPDPEATAFGTVTWQLLRPPPPKKSGHAIG